MDKNTWIGFLLIALIIIGFSWISRPSQEELAARQHYQDSIALVQEMERQAQAISEQISESQRLAEQGTISAANTLVEDTTGAAAGLQQRLLMAYGDFAVSAVGTEQFATLENNKIRLTFDTKGGRLYRSELKEYHAFGDTINPLCLFSGTESSLAFTLITANNRVLSTSNLYFTPLSISDSVLIMRLHTAVEDAYMDFVYTLPANEYMWQFDIVPHNMQAVLAQNMSSLEMLWQQRIPQQEKGRRFEERYAQLQYRTKTGDIEQLSEQKEDQQKEAASIQWIGYKDQFFSTVMIAGGKGFQSSLLTSTPLKNGTGYIKEYTTTTVVDFEITQPVSFRYYTGPNHYNTLKAYDEDKEKADKLYLKSLVPLGWKIVSWVNTLLVIPMFDLFTGWGLNIGLVILLMTIVIKLIILPFVWKSYQSSAKMRVLKPQIDEINKKFGEDKLEERQKATMALYQRAGVSPMSGCLPMLFQMPVVMAMFWFFPTAIELRGKSFLWADDLSTYDDVIHWSTNLPFIGDHLSLFCILFTIVNVVYTYFTMQTQNAQTEGQPGAKMMKWMMYLMPLMFFFIFNDYAAGLSYYYLLALFFSIFQMLIFRWTTDDAKLLAELEANAKKKEGKAMKRSGLMARLEKMQQESLKTAREQAQQQAKQARRR